jgi:putative glutamine amidotransferase
MQPLIGITGRKDTSARLLNSPMFSVGQTYVHAIQKVGGTPIILPPVLEIRDWQSVLERVDGILLSGGEDIAPTYYHQTPAAWMGGVDDQRDRSELSLVRAALERGLPILGICRGHQVLNVALGGELYQDITAQVSDTIEHAYVPGRPMENSVHKVEIEAQSRMAEILAGTEFDVNSAHHQAVSKPGEGLRVVARASDGIIEGLEMPDRPFVVSVQWHPEAMVKIDPTMYPLFEAFVEATQTAH